MEYPYEGRVVIRKKIPVHVTAEEVAVVEAALKAYSPVQDFIITAEGVEIAIHISQFSHYFKKWHPTAAEIREAYGDKADQWKTYNWLLTFALLDRKTRKFQVIRKASVQYDAIPIDEGYDLQALAEKYCYHVGRESLLSFWIPGEDWQKTAL